MPQLTTHLVVCYCCRVVVRVFSHMRSLRMGLAPYCQWSPSCGPPHHWTLPACCGHMTLMRCDPGHHSQWHERMRSRWVHGQGLLDSLPDKKQACLRCSRDVSLHKMQLKRHPSRCQFVKSTLVAERAAPPATVEFTGPHQTTHYCC